MRIGIIDVKLEGYNRWLQKKGGTIAVMFVQERCTIAGYDHYSVNIVRIGIIAG